MNVNTPDTGREVQVPEGAMLVTKTDPNGRIIYCSDASLKFSGFSRDDLLGEKDNARRHADVPAAVLKDMWATVKQGYPWKGTLKNRCKNGDFFWVDTSITPIYKNFLVHEIMMVCYSTTGQQVSDAEALFRNINAGKVNLKPKASLMERLDFTAGLPFWKQLLVAMTGLVVPSILLVALLIAEQRYAAGAGVALISGVFGLLGLRMASRFRSVFDQISNALYRLTDGEFRNKIDLHVKGDLGDLLRAMQGMQVKLNYDLNEAVSEATSANRVKQALDNVETNVILTDADYNIIYLNDAVVEMFRDAEDDIRNDLPDFEVDSLLGSNIDIFHKNPAHQRNMLDRLSETFKSTLNIGGRTLDIIANPITNDSGERLGTVVEWQDRTQEVHIEQEIAEFVDAVKRGDLNNRIELEGKQGFMAVLSTGINGLADSIDKVFSDIQHVIGSMAEGNLSDKISGDYEGTYASIQANVNATQDKLADIFEQIRQSADFINNSSQEIASGNNNLSHRAEEQAASLEQTAASMEQLTSAVKNNADNAQQANEVASDAGRMAGTGGDVVNRAVQAMDEINTSSNKIAEIIGVIDEIAFQTNLLALNASVEAARAGEQGRGFSVVATEVRNLAQRSATAAKESKEQIQNSVEKVRIGAELVNESGETLREIVASVNKVSEFVAQIATASQQQSSGIDQVNVAVGQMDEITQQNAALAEQASAASVSMSEQSDSMMQVLAFFNNTRGSSVPNGSARSGQSNEWATAEPEEKRVVQTPKLANSRGNAALDDQEWEEF